MWVIFLLPVIIVTLVWIFRRNLLTSWHSNVDSSYPINTDTSNSYCASSDVGDKDNLRNTDCNSSDNSGSDSSSDCGGDN